eukprot:6096091-Alexandrium_andersonii.AAC.1
MGRLSVAAPESRGVMQTQACRRLGPQGRSFPEHFYWRYTDFKCRAENRPVQGWPVQLLSG